MLLLRVHLFLGLNCFCLYQYIRSWLCVFFVFTMYYIRSVAVRSVLLRTVAVCSVSVRAYALHTDAIFVSALCVLALGACFFYSVLRAFLLRSCARRLLRFLVDCHILRSVALPSSFVPSFFSLLVWICRLLRSVTLLVLYEPYFTFCYSVIRLCCHPWHFYYVLDGVRCCDNVVRSIDIVFDIDLLQRGLYLAKLDDSVSTNFWRN